MALLGSGVTFECASQPSLCMHQSISGATCRLSSSGYGRLLQGKLIKPMVCRPYTCLDLNRKQMTWSVQASVDTNTSPEIKIERHGTALLEGVPHLTDWLPDLPTYDSPLYHNPAYVTGRDFFVGPYDVVARNVVVPLHNPGARVYFRRAGPSDKVYFKPEEVRACVVTCGGLCPGLNTVIREIVCGLWNQYGVRDIVGIEGGYRGFYARNTVPLNPKIVNDIHKRGGTILGTSRGGHDTSKIVSSIEDRGINQVYIIGGDGTQKGAAAIYKEVRRRGLKVNVTGIPKTIDNDIAVIDRSFGFDTAVEEAQRAINAAHTEAESAENGIGLVKLMGRYSGYIAMYATLASRDVDLCLIPEVPFYLEGEGGLYEFAEKRLRENGHMVIVVAEGAGQELLNSVDSIKKRDASGNPLLLDTGLWLSGKLKDHFRKTNKDTLNLKYIDPTYMIRAIPSNAADNVYCTLLAQFGIHGAMAGYSGFTVGPVNGRHCYIPISRVTEMPNRVNISDRMWARLLSSTNQPAFIDADTKISQELELKGKDPDPLPALNTKTSELVELKGKDSDPLPALNTKTSEPVELRGKDSVPSPALSASLSQVPASTSSDHEGVNGLSLKGGEQETVQKMENAVNMLQHTNIECTLVDEQMVFGYARLSRVHQKEILKVLAAVVRVYKQWINGFEAWSDDLKKKMRSFV